MRVLNEVEKAIVSAVVEADGRGVDVNVIKDRVHDIFTDALGRLVISGTLKYNAGCVTTTWTVEDIARGRRDE